MFLIKMKDLIQRLLREGLEDELKFYHGTSAENAESLHREQIPDFAKYKGGRFKGFYVTSSLSKATQTASEHNGQVISVMISRDKIINLEHITNKNIKELLPDVDRLYGEDSPYRDTLRLNWALKHGYGAIRLDSDNVVVINPSVVKAIHKAL